MWVCREGRIRIQMFLIWWEVQRKRKMTRILPNPLLLRLPEQFRKLNLHE